MKIHYMKLKTLCLFVLLTLSFGLFAQSTASIIVTAPSGAEATFAAQRAAFGPQLTAPVSGPVVEAIDTNTVANTACAAITNDLSNSIALIDRGVCAFVQKVTNAQTAGAIAVIICNNDVVLDDKGILLGGTDPGTLTIPTISVPYATCQTLRLSIDAGLTVTLSPDGVPAVGNTVCANATPVTAGDYSFEPLTSGFGGIFASTSNARWYSYTATDNVLVTVTNCGEAPDTRVSIVTTEDCATYTALAQNDDCAADIFSSEVQFVAQVGQTYYILWDDRWDDSGSSFTITEGVLPSADVTFSVDMSQETVSADGVFVTYAPYDGTGLNDVVILPMADVDADGVYTATATLSVLDTIGYFFINGMASNPLNFEAVPAECGLEVMQLGLTFTIRPLLVEGATTLDVVCFGGCERCVFVVDDCDNPFSVVDDNADSYMAGANTADGLAAHWSLWPGATIGAEISAEQASSGANSFKVIGNTGQDIVFAPGNYTSGHYRLSWDVYIPAGRSAYFNVQHQLPTAAAGFWAFDVYFNEAGSGVGALELNDDAATIVNFDYPEDEWFRVVLFFDLDNDEARMIVGENAIAGWRFSDGVTNGGAASDLLQFSGVNFYSATTNDIWYFDNVLFVQIPAAGEGTYCYTATPIAAGTHTVSELDCFGAGYDLDSDGEAGYAGQWFSYVAEGDGFITVENCGGGADSRVWVFEGDCHSLDLVGMNDDQCDLGSGDEYASYREVPVTAGSTYYILWDDAWEATGFDFRVTFTAGELELGAFCESAIIVQPGEQVLEAFVGDAAVAGPLINTFNSSTTPYSRSTWYSFTPEEDGFMSINSCDGGTDTYLFVYDGECGSFSSLNLLGSSDDAAACSPSSALDSIMVTAGTTYYIEWIDRYNDEPFFWQLNVGSSSVEVTFQVDMELSSVDPSGVYLAGTFSNFENLPMTDTDGDGVYTYTTRLDIGADHQYKFKNGVDGWESINTSLGENCALGDFGNRVLRVPEANIELPVVCFAYCVDCQTVDVDDLAFDQGISVFPNPASEMLNVQFNLDEVSDHVQVRLVNMLGEVLTQQKLDNVLQSSLEIPVNKLPAGTYLLHITSGELQTYRKVVVE